jgi:hypothetical protein
MIRRILRKGIRFFPLLVVFLCLANILMTNHLASSGTEIHQIDIAIESIRQENEVLRIKIASVSSLMTVSTQADAMGLSKPSKTQFVTLVPESLPVALGYPQ